MIIFIVFFIFFGKTLIPRLRTTSVKKRTCLALVGPYNRLVEANKLAPSSCQLSDDRLREIIQTNIVGTVETNFERLLKNEQHYDKNINWVLNEHIPLFYNPPIDPFTSEPLDNKKHTYYYPFEVDFDQWSDRFLN